MWRSRPRLANLLLEKADSDAQMLAAAQQTGHQFWYSLEHPELLTAELRATFQETTYDEETEAFVNQSLAISNNICLQVWYSMAAALLSLAMSRTSINGLLGRGGMFIFSRTHLRAFLGLPDTWSPIQQRLLDIGAGDGGVTTVMHQFFGKVSAVEASKVMEWRLAQRGFHVLPPDRWASSGPYDLISALNLLDRHHDPGQLLADLHSLTSKSGCCVLLSVVLPVSQYVEFGPKGGGTAAKKTLISSSSTTCDDRRFERQANALVEQVFKPAGFQLLRWTRLPYLCEGDLTQAFYKLDDAVFLLKPIPKTGDDIFTHKSVPNGTVEGTIVCIQDEL